MNLPVAPTSPRPVFLRWDPVSSLFLSFSFYFYNICVPNLFFQVDDSKSTLGNTLL